MIAILPARSTADELRCSLCDAVIQGPYVTFHEVGITACAACAAAKACECGLPLAGRNRGRDGHCERCIHRALRCNSCGRPIFGRYFEITGAPGQYCQECRESAPACATCGAPTRSSVTRDGRILCPACDRGRVEGSGAYDEIYRRVRERARARLGLVLARHVPLVVESSRVIGDHPGLPDDRDGLTGLYTRDGRGNGSIHVISDLTEGHLVAVLAHELAHAWQAEHCPDDQSLRVREGFAEWVAWHLVADEPGGAKQREIIARRTDEYGRGFRLFAGLEAQGGTDLALWWARRVVSEEDDGEG